jgi:hypothetical protein
MPPSGPGLPRTKRGTVLARLPHPATLFAPPGSDTYLLSMAARKKAAPPPPPDLKLRGLSYSDWEDEAAQLRLQIGARAAQRKRAINRADEMLASVDDELEAMASVIGTLDRPDAIRLRCVRDLLIALRASLEETSRRLSEPPSPRRRTRKKPTPAI